MKNSIPTISGYVYEGNYGVNALKVAFPNLTLYYSYETVIAFQYQGNLTIRKNDWAQTTGKHLNAINTDKSIRIDGTEFETKLETVLKELGLS